MLYAKNDSQRLKNELTELRTKNKELFDLIIGLYHYAELQFDKDVIMTMIHRTDEEQDEIYKDSERYKKKKFKSPHQFYQGIDIRNSIYSQEELDQIVKYLNDKYNDKNYYKWTTKVHVVGNRGMHFHIQFVKNQP